ncbi:anaerobic ribonucleoside-triphosphate reductase [Seleniivibrio woodruffii]|jgi:anaerobic ribonucleoside-triphosphate reductase|uniref:anaerobic ribonucleoside-triphosphate reductase n=1 Tax=Seleniivibrio woodruffii TaxID=1078050 RepID=UPI0026EFE131|nr:anaerobic ribonucleoside-triphosphate reductase [Seleniivibrio woodruffii]
MDKKEELQKLETELDNVKGTPCDVYSRVVGYHSPVKQWNEGKKEEFEHRETFQVK